MPSAKATIAAPVAACAQRAPWKSPETSTCRSDRSARCSSDGAIDLLSLVEWARKLSRSRSRLSRMKAVSYPSATKRMPGRGTGLSTCSFSRPTGPCLRTTSASRAISSISSRGVHRRIANANFIPSGRPWKMLDSGKRMRVAAVAPPKMTEHPQIAAHRDHRVENEQTESRPAPVAISTERSTNATCALKRHRVATLRFSH